MSINSRRWFGPGAALLIGLAPLAGCGDDETETVTPSGTVIEREDDEVEIERPDSSETEIERDGDTVTIENEAP